jgi:hypothetical protein
MLPSALSTVFPGELVEDDALADVGVPGQTYADKLPSVPGVSLSATFTLMSMLHRVFPHDQ